MENNYDNLDGNWDAMLKKFAARAELPKGPGEFRKARWDAMLSEQSVRRNRWNIGRFVGYAATAAVAIIAVSIAIFAFRPAMTAQTAIAAFDNTVASRPVVLMEARDFVYKNNAFRLKSYIDNTSGDMFTRLEVKNVSLESPQFLADVCILNTRSGGSIYIKKLSKDGVDLLEGLGGELTLPVVLPSALSCGMVPQKLDFADVKAMVESLSKAGEDFKISGAGRDVVIEGTITRPEEFDVTPLVDAFEMAGIAEVVVPLLKADITKIDPKIIRLINSAGLLLSDKRSAGNVAKKTMSAVTYLIIVQQELAKIHAGKTAMRMPTELRDAALGARIRIDYNRDEKTIQNVTIDNFGPSKGALSLRFVTVEEFKTATAVMNAGK